MNFNLVWAICCCYVCVWLDFEANNSPTLKTSQESFLVDVVLAAASSSAAAAVVGRLSKQSGAQLACLATTTGGYLPVYILLFY